MSYMATAVRVFHASTAAIGEWNCAAQASRAGGTHSAGRSSTRAAFASYQCGRSQPPPSRKNGAELLLPGVERADPQVARGLPGLQRVQDVVDLDEVLLGGLADVVRGELDVLEAVHVAARAGRLGAGRRPAAAPRPGRPRRSG